MISQKSLCLNSAISAGAEIYLFSVFPQDGKKQMLSGEGERSGRRICLGTGPGSRNQPERREEIREEDLSGDMPGRRKSAGEEERDPGGEPAWGHARTAEKDQPCWSHNAAGLFLLQEHVPAMLWNASACVLTCSGMQALAVRRSIPPR